MNFQTILEELDRLYEELPAKEATKKEIDEFEESEVVEACDKKSLTEEADDEEIEIVDDEAPEEEPEEEVEEPAVEEEEARQLILECDNCGALVIRAEADVKVDEETDLANVGDVCEFCEESVGSKIVGVVAPYEAVDAVEESLEEGIFGLGKKKSDEDNDEVASTKAYKNYPDNYWVCLAEHPKTGKYTYVSGKAPTASKRDAEEVFNYQKHNAPKTSHYVCTYGEAKELVGRPFTESLEEQPEELEELLDFDVDLPISVNADGNSVAVGGVA